MPVFVPPSLKDVVFGISHRNSAILQLVLSLLAGSYYMFISLSLKPSRYRIASNPMVEMECLADAFTLGLAWKAMPSPASLSMGRSLDPSPTAITCSRWISSLKAISLSSSAFFSPSIISPTCLPVSLPSLISSSLAKT